MKIIDGFWTRKVGGAYVAVPLRGAALALSCVINLNAAGALLFARMQKGATRAELIELFLSEYDADEATAARAVDEFAGQLANARVLEA